MRFLFVTFIFLPGLLLAQTSGLVQNFDDNAITGWATGAGHERTFQLSAENGALKIGYTRTASSEAWDNMNFTPSASVNITNNPLITVRIQSTVNVVLALKPVYESGTDSWLQQNILGDGNWKTISIPIATAGEKKMRTMYMYLDGGSTAAKSGVIRFDEIRFGDSAFVIADNSALVRAVDLVGRLAANTTEGGLEGQFPPGSKAVLQEALAKAEALVASNDQKKISQAVWDVFDAASTYEKNVTALPVKLFDPKATKETRYLYLNMAAIAPNSLLFGMHDVTGYGVGWSGDDDRSDIKSVCGEYPSFYSEDITAADQN